MIKIKKINNTYKQVGTKLLPVYKIFIRENETYSGTKDECDKFMHSLFNTRVIVVGPSPHLEGMGMGNIIDNYDIVVRINNSYTIKNHKDYGSRTDMIFINEMWMRNNNNTLKSLIKEYGEKNVILKKNLNITKPEGYTQDTNAGSNMGVLTILHLINEGFKNIDITGFSFYQNHPFYVKEHYENQKGMVLEGESHPQKVTVKEINELINLGYIKLLKDTQQYFNIAKQKYL